MNGSPERREVPPLPSPEVELPGTYLSRIGAFATQLAAAREREEVGRRRTLQGDGQEFVGHRPYRPGEDLRRFDWDLLARLDRPYVRVHRSEAREDWWIAVDASASMGVGRPGKLQSAAEAAGASIAVGLRLGARITLVSSGGEGPSRPVQLTRTAELGHGLAALGSMSAGGRGGLEDLVASRGHRAGARGCGRLLLFGDFIDVDPADVLRLLGGRRRPSPRTGPSRQRSGTPRSRASAAAAPTRLSTPSRGLVGVRVKTLAAGLNATSSPSRRSWRAGRTSRQRTA